MKKFLGLNLVCGLLAVVNFLPATQWVKTYTLDPYIGPEIYYVQRTREGGGQQSGMLYGGRIGYDHIGRNKFYWGIDGMWARGILDGHGKEKQKVKSELTDANFEARFGFTVQSKYWRCASFTPFGGLGYYWEKNFYKHPSPLKAHLKNYFTYAAFGFLSQIFITPTVSIGANLKVRYLLEGKQRISHDPDHDPMNLNYEENFQYRAEIPLIYFYCWKANSLAIGLVPFFEYQHYGHRANFPFDFLETKFKFYGGTLKLFYLF